MSSVSTEINRKSFMNLLHPLAKLLVFILLIASQIILADGSFYKLAITLLIVLFLVLWGTDKAKGVLKASALYYPVIFVITMLFPFSGVNSEASVNFMGIAFYKSGLSKFLSYNLRMMSIIIYANLFSSTTSILDMVAALERIRVPKVIITILFLVNRFITLLWDDIQKTIVAYKSRHLKMGVSSYFKYFSFLLSSIFEGMFKRNESIYIAMSSRGFHGELRAVNLLKWKFWDITYISTILVIFLLIIFAW